MLKDHSLKLVSLSLSHLLFSCSLWLKLSISFSSLQEFFLALLRKIKAVCFCIPPPRPLHGSILEDHFLFFSSSGMYTLKRVDGLQWQKRKRWWWGGSEKLRRIWRVHDSQSQTDLFLCLRSSFLLRFRLEELVGWKRAESWVQSLPSYADKMCGTTFMACTHALPFNYLDLYWKYA